MKLTFLLELLLILIIIAFAASKPLNSENGVKRSLRYQIESRQETSSAKPADDDDDDDFFGLVDDDDDDSNAVPEKQTATAPAAASSSSDEDDDDDEDEAGDDDDVLGIGDDEDEKKDPEEDDDDADEFVLFGEDFLDGIFDDDDDDEKKKDPIPTAAPITAAAPAVPAPVTNQSPALPAVAAVESGDKKKNPISVLPVIPAQKPISTDDLLRPLVNAVQLENIVPKPQFNLQHTPALLELAQNSISQSAGSAENLAEGEANSGGEVLASQAPDSVKGDGNSIESAEISNEEGLIVVSDDVVQTPEVLPATTVVEEVATGEKATLQNDKDMESVAEMANQALPEETPSTTTKKPKKEDESILGLVSSLISEEIDDDDDVKIEDSTEDKDPEESNEDKSEEETETESNDDDNEVDDDADSDGDNTDKKGKKKKKPTGIIGSIGETLGFSRIFRAKN